MNCAAPVEKDSSHGIHIYVEFHPSAGRGEGRVRFFVKASAIDDPQFSVIQAGVARHEGFRAVLEADLGRVFEGVVDELSTVGRPELDALGAADDDVV